MKNDCTINFLKLFLVVFQKRVLESQQVGCDTTVAFLIGSSLDSNKHLSVYHSILIQASTRAFHSKNKKNNLY